MEVRDSEPITALLAAVRAGDERALDQVFALVYDELRRLARAVRKGRAGTTLNTTALVHEAYLRLTASERLSPESRLHFMRIAARAMRQVVVATALRRTAGKRGGGQALVTLNEEVHGGTVQAEQFLALHEALERLEALDVRQAQIVECRFFAGLTVHETAEALSVSTATAKRDWRAARLWLAQEMGRYE